MSGFLLGSFIGLFVISAAVFLFSVWTEHSRKKARERFLSRINNAEALMQSGMHDDGLAIYSEILESLGRGNKRVVFRDIYALCRYGEGKYFQAKSKDIPDACGRAIDSYEGFLQCLSMPDIGIEGVLKKIDTCYNLGLLYVSFVREQQVKNRTACLKRAESLLTSALAAIDEISEVTREAPAEDAGRQQELCSTRIYASIHQALGTISFELSGAETPKNAERSLMKAIDAYDKAQQVYTSGEYPLEHGNILEAKAAAYKKLFSLSENIGFMTIAVDTMKALVDHLKKSGRAGELFTALRDLGDTYMLVEEHLSEELEPGPDKEAISAALVAASECYKKMIDMHKEVFITSGELSAVYRKLGNAAAKIYQRTLEEAVLQESLTMYQKALEHVQEGSLDAANIQSVLGDLYSALARTRNRKENITRARASYNAALKVYEDMGLVPYKRNVELALKNIDGW